jgi:hypothetical protein
VAGGQSAGNQLRALGGDVDHQLHG